MCALATAYTIVSYVGNEGHSPQSRERIDWVLVQYYCSTVVQLRCEIQAVLTHTKGSLNGKSQAYESAQSCVNLQYFSAYLPFPKVGYEARAQSGPSTIARL